VLNKAKTPLPLAGEFMRLIKIKTTRAKAGYYYDYLSG